MIVLRIYEYFHWLWSLFSFFDIPFEVLCIVLFCFYPIPAVLCFLFKFCQVNFVFFSSLIYSLILSFKTHILTKKYFDFLQLIFQKNLKTFLTNSFLRCLVNTYIFIYMQMYAILLCSISLPINVLNCFQRFLFKFIFNYVLYFILLYFYILNAH